MFFFTGFELKHVFFLMSDICHCTQQRVQTKQERRYATQALNEFRIN